MGLRPLEYGGTIMGLTRPEEVPRTGPLACNGSLVEFSSDFIVSAIGEEEVLLVNEFEEESTLSYPSDYSMVIASTGLFTITTVETYGSNYSIMLTRNTPKSQLVAYRTGGDYAGSDQAASHNKAMQILQEHNEQLGRCVKNNISETAPVVDDEAYIDACESFALRAEAAAAAAGDPILQQSFTATASQDTFDTVYSLPANEAALEVYVDGVKQEKNTIQITGDKQFEIGAPLAGGETVEYITRTTGLEMVTSTVNAWTGQQYAVNQSLTSGTTIPWDLDTQQSASVSLAHNATLNTPTNMKPGATYTLFIYQTGSYTLDFGSSYYWVGGIKPSITTGAGSVDIISFISDGTYMYGVLQDNFQVGV